MNRMVLCIIGLVLVMLPAVSLGQNYIDKPESVAFDTLRNLYLVSNIGDGAIIQIDTNGVQDVWTTGLGACLGNQIVGDTIFVSVPGAVVGIDMETRDPVWYFGVPSGRSPDGLAADTSGYLYVLIPQVRFIYKVEIATGTFWEYVTTGLPVSAQDMTFDEKHNRLLVCAYSAPSSIMSVNLNDSTVTTAIANTMGGWDGISLDNDGNLYLACSTGGATYRYDSTFGGLPELLMAGQSEPAGLDCNRRDRILAVPNFSGNRVDFIDLSIPKLSVECSAVDDSGGDGDGHAEAGETVTITPTVYNAGFTATNVTGEMTCSDSYVTVVQSSAGFGSELPWRETASSVSPYEITVDAGCPDPYIVDVDLLLQADGEYSTTESFKLFVGNTKGFVDSMETGEADWQHYPPFPGYADQWHMDTYRAHSGTTSWKVGGAGPLGYANRSYAALVSQPILLPPSAKLSFWHWIDIEEDAVEGLAWDAAIVMIRTNGCEWLPLLPLTSYTHTTMENSASPFETGTPCFSGAHDWEEVEFDLWAYSGVVQFMFLFGSDAAANGEGWYIDDVVVSSNGCCGLYTGGFTGNCNCDEDGKRNLADISRLIDRVYLTKTELCCEENGNVNGDVDEKVNLADISKLIDHVYLTKQETAACY